MKIKSVQKTGLMLNYPKGCWEVVIEFDRAQEHPNYGPGWGLGDFGFCKTYQGVQSPDASGYIAVVAYYDGQPTLPVSS